MNKSECLNDNNSFVCDCVSEKVKLFHVTSEEYNKALQQCKSDDTFYGLIFWGIILFFGVKFYIKHFSPPAISNKATIKLLTDALTISEEDLKEILKDKPVLLFQNENGESIFSLLVQRKDLYKTDTFYNIMNLCYPSAVEKVKEHYDTLLIKAKQKIFTDDYGNLLDGDFEKELKYFAKYTLNAENYKDIENFSLLAKGIFTYLLEQNGINNLKDVKQAEMENKKNIITGVDYENYIEEILTKAGFEVRRTPVTGDQGVDLIANKNDTKFAIQCKYYSKPVGNGAVQEIIAGKDFYKCDVAVVCSNNSFTKSAVSLAYSSDVVLCSDLDIVNKLS